MKFNFSLLCLLLNCFTFIYSADPRQSHNPLGMTYRLIIKNDSEDTINLAISISGGKVNPTHTHEITALPKSIEIFCHEAETDSQKRFAGVGIAIIKNETPTILYAKHTDLPTGQRIMEDHIFIHENRSLTSLQETFVEL